MSSESWFTFSDGLKAYEQTWKPKTDPTAQLVVLHGFSDHSGMYSDFATRIVSSYPIQVTAWDRRGWGRSVRQTSDRGLTGGNQQVLADINEYLHHIATKQPKLPLFVLGHSMGGQELIYYMLSTSSYFQNNPRPQIAGIVLNAPFIALCDQRPWLRVAIGRTLSYLIPNAQIGNKPFPEYVSRDAEVGKAWAEDPLNHHTGTLQGIREMFDRENALTQLADGSKPVPATLNFKLSYPVLWGHGTADAVVRHDTSKALCDRLDAVDAQPDSKVFKTYDGWFHQLHAEPGEMKQTYADDVGGWIMNIATRT